MASLAGFWCRNALGMEPLARMAARLRCRPNDHAAEYASPSGRAAFAGRSAIAGQDFGTNASGTVRCLFDGELFNKNDVRKFVTSRTRQLKHESPAELVAHLWEAKGRDLMMSLRGAFAMVVWDETNDTLFLARDAMGHRPLYVHDRQDGLAFSSELPAVLAFDTAPPALDTRALDCYLAFHAAPPPLTLFQGIRKLPPAGWLELRDGHAEEGRYWSPAYYDTTGQNPEELAQHAFSYLFESVKAHTRDLDVPLAYLEGDPLSAVLAGLASLAKRGKLRTFSLLHKWVPDEARHGALLGARRFGSDHREEEISETIADLVDAIADCNTEALPIARMAPAILFARSAGAADPGVLTAAGGELFVNAGRRPVPSPLSTLGLWRKLKEQTETAARAPSAEVLAEFEGRMVFAPLERAQLSRNAGPTAMDTIGGIMKGCPSPGDAMTAAYADAVFFLPELWLGPVEHACRTTDVCARAPLADPSAVQLLVPVVHSLASMQPLQGLRRVFDSLVPEDPFWESRWATPEDWEHAAARELAARACEVLIEPLTLQRGVFEAAVVKRLVTEHRTHVEKHDRRLLLLLALELWHRKFIDSSPAPAGTPTPR